jgi:uncharacterized membrane protein YkvA (DUF1232 family)
MARSTADDLRFVRAFADWTSTLPADIDATFALLTHDGIGAPGRRSLAAGLSYLLTQFDLIPDHERIGTVDDAMVLRVAYSLAAEHAKAGGAEETAKLAKDDPTIREFLGDGLYKKLRDYVAGLADKAIRARTADQILASEDARKDLRRELDESKKQLPAPLQVDEAKVSDTAVGVLGYLKTRLG